MTAEASSTPSRGTAAPERLIVVPLLMFLALLPPEARWESMLAVSVFSALFVLVAWFRPDAPPLGTTILVGAALALALAGSAPAPAAGLPPTALFVLAGAVGLAAAGPGLRLSGPRVAQALAALGGVVGLHAVYQKLWGLERLALRIAAEPALPDHAELLGRTVAGRAFANFSTPAALGGYLILALPVTVLLAASTPAPGSGESRSRMRWVWWGLAALQFCGLLATASATATAALIAALALAALLWGRGRSAFGLAVLVLGLLLVAVVAFRGGKLLSLTDPGSPWRLRGGNFRSAAMMTVDHPWRGVGPGGFAEHYPSYRLPGDNETRHVHNLPLECAAELGLAGGLIGGGALFYFFLMPLVRARRESEPWRCGLALGLATFAIHNLADYTAFMPSMLLTAAIARGVLSAQAGNTMASRDVVRRLLTAATAVVVIAAAALLALDALSDDARLRGRVAAFAGDHSRAEELASRAALLARWDIGAALFSARAAARAGAEAPLDQRRVALERAERAVRLSPVNPAGRETRARARLNLGDYPGAYADLVEAARLYPLEPRFAEARDGLRVRLPYPSAKASPPAEATEDRPRDELEDRSATAPPPGGP